MKFIDENHIEGEMSDVDFQKKIDEEAERRKAQMKRYGRDGSFRVYEELFYYKGVPYYIRINRYYQIGVPLAKIDGMNKISKWAVLESPEELRELADFIENNESVLGLYKWMYRDTLHVGQENWTLKIQVEQMHKEAKECVDVLPTIELKLTEYYQRQLKTLEGLKTLMKESVHSKVTKKKVEKE